MDKSASLSVNSYRMAKLIITSAESGGKET
jgi:hypothetical protein